MNSLIKPVRLAPRVKQKSRQQVKILAERLPQVPMEKLNAKQKAAAAAICAGPRGDVRGPFVPMMRSPDLTLHTQALGAYIRWEVKVPFRIAEFAGLMTARAWSCQYEWTVHVPHALRGGVPQATIDALAEGRRPDKLRRDEAVTYEFVSELIANQSVSDTTYARAVRQFGEEGVVDLTGVVGYYAMIAMLMNVARTAPPKQGEMTLKPLPEYFTVR